MFMLSYSCFKITLTYYHEILNKQNRKNLFFSFFKEFTYFLETIQYLTSKGVYIMMVLAL